MNLRELGELRAEGLVIYSNKSPDLLASVHVSKTLPLIDAIHLARAMAAVPDLDKLADATALVQTEMSRVLTLNAELLAACRAFVDWLGLVQMHLTQLGPQPRAALNKARAVIAKAERYHLRPDVAVDTRASTASELPAQPERKP